MDNSEQERYTHEKSSISESIVLYDQNCTRNNHSKSPTFPHKNKPKIQPASLPPSRGNNKAQTYTGAQKGETFNSNGQTKTEQHKQHQPAHHRKKKFLLLLLHFFEQQQQTSPIKKKKCLCE